MAFNKPATGFGGFGQTSTAFGSGGTTTFGATATPSLFGGQAQTSTFGAQPQTSTFGAQPQTNLFGATQQTGTTGFGTSGGTLFGGASASGGTATLGTQNNAFGTSGGSLFGAKPTGTAFGTPAATGSTFGGFGTATSTTGFAGFGNTSFNQPAASTAQPSLFSGFGQQTQTTNALTNFNFGTANKPLGAVTPGFGTSGGSTFSGFGGFGQAGQQQQQQNVQQQQAPSATDLLYSSIYQVNIYGDERDALIAKFNVLMAFAGIGKGYFNANQSVDYSPNSDLFKFTSVVYNAKPSSTQKDSLVYMSLNKKYEQVLAEESTLVSSLSQIFGSRPNMTVVIDSINLVDSEKSRVLFYINEKLAQCGSNKRVPNSDIVNYLLQPAPKQQLTALGVYDVNVYQSFDEDSLTQYLETPPPGINAILWRNAVRDNPDPEKFIPVPIVGFEGIKQRIKLQDEEAKLQTAFLNKLASRIADLNTEYEKSMATISKYKQNILSLNNRLLKVVVKQEITRNIGLSLTPTEEIIRSDLESIAAMIHSNPAYNFKSKLSSMLSSMKLHCNRFTLSQDKYVMDTNVLSEIRTIFAMEQKAIMTLLDTFNQYRGDVSIIKTDLEEILSQQQ